ncbi:MAG: hypothetical protein WC273_06705 [Dehalococcoidia bacterium]
MTRTAHREHCDGVVREYGNIAAPSGARGAACGPLFVRDAHLSRALLSDLALPRPSAA